ncbi:MAG: tetratricopeptide repeat protein [Cellulophaga sp.]
MIKTYGLRVILFSFLFFVSQVIISQNDLLAKQYFNDGDFEKAVVFYEKLVKKSPRRSDFAENLVACYQQLEKYTLAEEFLLKKLKEKHVYPTFFIELGHNYSLQKLDEKALTYYKKALNTVSKNPNYGYGIGLRFQKYVLLDFAITAFTKAMQLNPQLEYNFQLARIYGEQGAIEKMYESYLNLIYKGKTSKSKVLRNIDDFISVDASSENNIKFRKTLLRKAQQNPNILWNELLSWLFIQEGRYSSAFNQEKAIYKRTDKTSTTRLESLGRLSLKNEDTETAITIFTYIVENSSDKIAKLNAQLHLVETQLLIPTEKKIKQIQITFDELMEDYGYHSKTLQLQVAYANFLTFKKENPTKAISILKKCLELPLNRYGIAYIKMTLGDILVFDKKFNQALIYFSQIQKNLKNDVIGQNARYKVAQTSFYKGDFDWALTQLKVLRSSTSQLIANDAMQLSLLISDNSFQDSTQIALKKYAHADLLAFQNKNEEAIEVLNDILINHKGEKIEDESLLKQGKLLEQKKDFEAAEFNYQKIVEFYSNDILADDAHFALAELYKNVLNKPQKAMEHYEKIIYNYQDSYYFPKARKNYRILRGDSIN